MTSQGSKYWDQVVEEIGPRLYRYFCVRFSDEQASDLTQETLLRFVRKVYSGEYDSEKGSPIMFAYGIAHFVKLETARANQFEQTVRVDRNVEDEPKDSSSIQESQLIQHQQKTELRHAFRYLTEDQQQVIELVVDEELTYDQIGELLSMPVGTVKSHMARAKARLSQSLRP